MGVIMAPAGAGAAWEIPTEELGPLRVVRQALAAASPGGGRVALRLPGPMAPHRRRAARIILQDIARAEGACILDSPATGDMLLLGASAEGAARAEGVLASVLGLPDPDGPAPPELWQLPEEAPALVAWAEAVARPPAPQPAPAMPGLAALDALLAEIPPDGKEAAALRVRQAVIHLVPGGAPRLAWCRHLLSRRALAARLGPLGEDPDLLAHAAEVLARRWLPLALPAAPGPLGAVPAMRPLPLAEAMPGPPDQPGAVAVLPIAAAFAPGAEERRARLRAAGWRLAHAGLDAAALRLLSPAALPPQDLLLLRWSAAIEDERGVQVALRRIDPVRLVLTGCDGKEALAWAFGRGIPHLAGPAIEALRPAGPAAEPGR